MNNASLTDDYPCAHCGYNLRGLSPEGSCPECATPVAQSLRGDLLEHADREWLERLRFGTTLLLWHIGLSIVGGIVVGVLVGIGMPPVLQSVLLFFGGAIGLWGSFMITTQEPRISLTEDPVTWRKVIRVCAAAAWIGEMVKQIELTGALGGVIVAVAAGLSLAGVVALFGELLYLRRFALRVPNPRLARSTKTVMWGLSASMTVLIAGGILLVIVAGGTTAVATGAGPGGGSLAGVVGGGIVVCGAFPLLVFVVWYVFLLGRYKKVFTAAVEASRNLDSPGGPPLYAPPSGTE
ncbi:MAG: hypothetical protein IID36_01655 [Planctomycetes bacterium]|nr:hypothetical protein [Planctomycetota bacterium]